VLSGRTDHPNVSAGVRHHHMSPVASSWHQVASHMIHITRPPAGVLWRPHISYLTHPPYGIQRRSFTSYLTDPLWRPLVSQHQPSHLPPCCMQRRPYTSHLTHSLLASIGSLISPMSLTPWWNPAAFAHISPAMIPYRLIGVRYKLGRSHVYISGFISQLVFLTFRHIIHSKCLNLFCYLPTTIFLPPMVSNAPSLQRPLCVPHTCPFRPLFVPFVSSPLLQAASPIPSVIAIPPVPPHAPYVSRLGR